MKKNRSTIILILIFLVGLSVMLYPTVSDYVNQRHQSRALASYDETVNEMSDADYTAYFEAADAYNQRLAATPNSFFTPEQVSGYDETLDVSGTGIMGYITIPRIGVELPFYHRGLPSAKLFTNLDELEAGDTFTITVLDRVLTYEVDQISIVLPTETDLLQPVEGQDYVTLMTCTPYGINTHRLLVRGHRVNTRESQKHVRVTADATRIDPIITAPVIALPMLAVLLIWLLVTTRKRPKAGKHEKTTRGDPHETNS